MAHQNMTSSHESPVKQIKTMGSIGNGSMENGSPFMHWAASPLYQFDCFSPDASNMSFTMTSPPCQFQSFATEIAQQNDNITSEISPSIFSPKESMPMSSKHPKKRDVYRDASTSLPTSIANVGDKVSPESRCESRNSLDLPNAASILDSPSFSLWSSVQVGVQKRDDLFSPPTLAMMSSSCANSSSKVDGHSRLWAQGIAGDADDDLFAATSHVMRMGASPLIGNDFLLEGGRQSGRKSMPTALKFKKSPGPESDYSMDVEDSNESYELETNLHKREIVNKRASAVASATATANKTAAPNSSRKKKPYVSPDGSVESSINVNSVGSVGSASHILSPQEGSSSVEKLSVAVKNQKFGVSSMVKPTMTSSVGANGRRLMKPLHSVLEKSDLSQYFGTRQGDEPVGDDSNNSHAALTLNTSSVEETVCNCKKSKCLKLYCDCFAVMNYCSVSCNCYDCCNTTERESIRLEAIKTTKERNASAFQTKINERDQHSTGCHCKNSQCLKKYCECYTGGAFCGQNCKCISCLNFSGSVDLVKARTSARDGDGPGSSRKRKESPSSVAFLDATPPAGPLKLLQPSKLGLSPELANPIKSITRIGGAAALQQQQQQQRYNAVVATPTTGVSTVLLERSHAPTITHYVPPKASVGGSVDMQQPGAKRSKVQPQPVQNTPVDAAQAGRQLRSRKGGAQEEAAVVTQSAASAPPLSSLKLQFQHNRPPSPATSSVQAMKAHSSVAVTSSAKKQVKFAPIVYEYPFFGAQRPKTPKFIALKCLDFLEGKDIYAMSQVNSLWNSAAMDDALWE